MSGEKDQNHVSGRKDDDFIITKDDSSPSTSLHNQESEIPSPSESPRDKKMRLTATDSQPIPGSSSGKPLSAKELLIAASPPRFINIEDIMKLKDGVTDMSLAHEIAVGDNFKLEPAKPDPNSLEGKIREVMHKAFWDTLSQSLKEDPPDYSHALVLLKEIKQGLVDLLLPQHARLRVAIDEALDLDLIEQQVEKGCLDFRSYAVFVIDKMAMLCAPVRDEQVASIRELKDVVDVYRQILVTLDLMKMDMVNFTITQFRPYVQRHSIEYEQKKFLSLLEVQRGNGIDGLQFTRIWLNRHAEKAVQNISSPTEPSNLTPSVLNAVLISGYLEVLEWDNENQLFPETLLMDQHRFFELRDKISWLTLVTSVLLVTYNTVGGAISGVTELKSKLTTQIFAVTKDSPTSKLPETISGIAEQVNKEVNQSLADRGFPQMKSEQQQLLKGQIVDLIEPNNAIYRLMKNRLTEFVEKVLAHPTAKDVQLPAGYSAVQDEVAKVLSQLIRLVGYNRAVFNAHYTDIISDVFQRAAQVPTAIIDSN